MLDAWNGDAIASHLSRVSCRVSPVARRWSRGMWSWTKAGAHILFSDDFEHKLVMMMTAMSNLVMPILVLSVIEVFLLVATVWWWFWWFLEATFEIIGTISKVWNRFFGCCIKSRNFIVETSCFFYFRGRNRPSERVTALVLPHSPNLPLRLFTDGFFNADPSVLRAAKPVPMAWASRGLSRWSCVRKHKVRNLCEIRLVTSNRLIW